MSQPVSSPPVVDRVYDALYEDEDARACRGIPEASCTDVPRNFFLNLTTQSLTKWGDALVNAKTTLPWLLTTLGAPGWIAAVLVPIRESGSMLPQLAIASWVRKRPIRKWSYVAGAVAQGLCVLSLAGVAVTLRGVAAGLAALLLVIAFSLSRGLCSVASKDVLGKTVPKRRRGRVSGLAASVSGFGTLIFAAWLWQNQGGDQPYVILLLTGGLFWLVASAIYSRIEEEPGATEGGANGLREAVAKMSLLRTDPNFRRFVIARSLLVGTALMAPFLVVLAQRRVDTSLAYFLAAQGLASLLSGSIWGSLADRSSRKVLIAAAVGAGILGSGVVIIDEYWTAVGSSPWFLPAAFFVLATLHDGVRLGRKTYVIDLVEGNKRTDYVAVSNTLLGIVLLAGGGIAALAQMATTHGAIALFAGTAFLAAAVATGLPEAEDLDVLA